MRQARPLVELLLVLAWVALAVHRVAGREEEVATVPLDPDVLALSPAEEAWFGVYLQDQKVGYAVEGEAPVEGGGRLVTSRAAFTVAAFGSIQQVVMASSALLDAGDRLERFDFYLASDAVRLSVRGRVAPGGVELELLQAGEAQELFLPMDEPPVIGASFPAWLRSREEDLHVGQVFEIPWFDPVLLQRSAMRVRVVGTEVLAGGQEAYWLERTLGDATTRVLVTPGGQVLREEGPMGTAFVREPPDRARALPDRPPVDIIALSAVRTARRIDAPRRVRRLVVRVGGVEPDRVPDAPPRQEREGDRVTVQAADLRSYRHVPVSEDDPELAPYLGDGPFLPVRHREIQDAAREVLAGAPDRLAAVRTLVAWVHDALEKVPVLGVPNALEVLRTRRGDCNEHTVLFVALARAAGIPARTVAGLAWSDRAGGAPGFYYHAWPEVFLGDLGWVAVDPTFGQVPADATHIGLVEGDLDRQIEIMGVLGRIALTIEEAS